MNGISIPLLIALLVAQPGDSTGPQPGTASHVVIPARNILHVGSPRASPSLLPNVRRPAGVDAAPVPVYIPSATYHPDGWAAHSRLAGDRFRW